MRIFLLVMLHSLFCSIESFTWNGQPSPKIMVSTDFSLKERKFDFEEMISKHFSWKYDSPLERKGSVCASIGYQYPELYLFKIIWHSSLLLPKHKGFAQRKKMCTYTHIASAVSVNSIPTPTFQRFTRSLGTVCSLPWVVFWIAFQKRKCDWIHHRWN